MNQADGRRARESAAMEYKFGPASLPAAHVPPRARGLTYPRMVQSPARPCTILLSRHSRRRQSLSEKWIMKYMPSLGATDEEIVAFFKRPIKEIFLSRLEDNRVFESLIVSSSEE